jgi:hypothetical protein
MSSRKRVIIELTDEQQKKIKTELGKEVIYVIFQLIGGSQLIIDASDATATADGR